MYYLPIILFAVRPAQSQAAEKNWRMDGAAANLIS